MRSSGRSRTGTGHTTTSSGPPVADIVDVVELGGGEHLTVDLLIEIEGVDRPVCAAQALFRHYPVKARD